MKKIILLVIVFICGFLFECISYADDTAIVFLNTNTDIVEKGEEIDISVIIEKRKTASFIFYFYYDNAKFEYVSGPEDANVIENKIIYIWYDKTGGYNLKDGEIAKFKFKSKEEGNAKFSIEGEFYDDAGTIMETNFNNIQVWVNEVEKETTESTSYEEIEYLKSNNTNLEILAVENTLINPAFDTNIINYEVEVSDETKYLNVLAIPENENAKVEIIGNEELKEGENLIIINVIGEDGVSKKTYQINAKKRTKEEEKIYEEKQNENKEKLESIYQSEKVSKEIENDNFQENKNGKKFKFIWLMGLIFFLFL